MYKILRKKVAASINTVDAPEQFEWGKWLRQPDLESFTIAKITSSLSNYKPDLSFSLPQTNSFDVKTSKVKLYKSKKKFSVAKEKTIKVFFRLAKPLNRKIKIFEADTGKIIFSFSLVKENSKYYNSVKNIEEAIISLKANPALKSFDLLAFKTALREILLEPLNSETIDIQAEIKKPKIKSSFKKIDTEFLEPKLLTEMFSLSKETYGEIFQPEFSALDKIPFVKNFEIPNVNILIDKLNKDKTSKKTDRVSIQFLNEKPSIEEVKILESENPRVLNLWKESNLLRIPATFTNNFLFQNDTSTYNYMFRLCEANISEESFSDISFTFLMESKESLISGDVLNQYHNQEIEDKNIITDNEDSSINILEPENINDESFNETISNILKPGIIESDKIEIQDQFLISFQKEGAELLANNKLALLNDEIGQGKTYQTISALKTLFNAERIDKILIVCNQGDIGLPYFDEGWAGKLKELADDITFSIIQGEAEERNLTWQESKNIFISNYETFFNDFSDGNLSLKILESFNCLIFDEAQNIIPKSKIFSRYLELKKPNTYLWFISGQLGLSDHLKNELNFQQNNSIIELGRNKKETYRELPEVVRQDIWHELDDEQKIEYENILSIGREKIEKLLQTGNPFIIQSNVFTLLHQLKQVCNFASQKNSSPKSEYLLNYIENVVNNGKKTIIFSQYEKMGVNKLVQVLNSNKIKYQLLHSGMSLNELTAAKKKFTSDKKTNVLINGIKSARTGITLPEVQYIVHFDQWWNPASLWKTEGSISNPEDEGINVYNYFTKNTVEEKIKKVLLRKGLLRKEIVEFLPVETINEMVSLDEWLEILEIGTASEKNNPEYHKTMDSKNSLNKALDTLSLDELSKKAEILFSRLGYKNLFLNKGNFEGEINIIGTMMENNSKTKIVAKCLFSDQIDIENIMEYIEALKNDKNLGKNFIVHFNGLEDKLPMQLKKDIILINKELFTNYLINFHLI